MTDLERYSFNISVLECLRNDFVRSIEISGHSPIANNEWTCRYIEAINAGILALKMQREELVAVLWDDEEGEEEEEQG